MLDNDDGWWLFGLIVMSTSTIKATGVRVIWVGWWVRGLTLWPVFFVIVSYLVLPDRGSLCAGELWNMLKK